MKNLVHYRIPNRREGFHSKLSNYWNRKVDEADEGRPKGRKVLDQVGCWVSGACSASYQFSFVMSQIENFVFSSITAAITKEAYHPAPSRLSRLYIEAIGSEYDEVILSYMLWFTSHEILSWAWDISKSIDKSASLDFTAFFWNQTRGNMDSHLVPFIFFFAPHYDPNYSLLLRRDHDSDF